MFEPKYPKISMPNPMYDLKQNLYLSGIGFDGNLKTNTIKASVDK